MSVASTIHHYIVQFFKLHFNIILLSIPGVPKWWLQSKFIRPSIYSGREN